MRCNNCGWNNPENLAQCEKCTYPLVPMAMDPKAQRPSPPSNDPSAKLSSTIKGGQIHLDPWDMPNTGEVNDQREPTPPPAPKPVVPPPPVQKPKPQAQKPAPVNPPPTPTPEPEPQPEAPKAPVDPFAGLEGNKFNQTFDPSRMAGRNKKFKLSLINKDGEEGQKDLEFSGDSVELNRDKVDPENYSITSKVQAVIEHDEGNWFILDQSDLQTTFVQVQRPTQLKDGDIILMGNRKFRFEELK